MSGRTEWIPGDVEPAGAGKELVGVLPFLKEIKDTANALVILRFLVLS